MKRVLSTLVKAFIWEDCDGAIKGIVEPDKRLSFYDQVKLMKSFCTRGDRLNANGGSEATMTA